MPLAPRTVASSSFESTSDVVLICESGKAIRVQRPLLAAASPLFNEVSGSFDCWSVVLRLMHPPDVRPLTADTAFAILPLLHQYDVQSVFTGVMGFLSARYPAAFSSDPASPDSLLRWLTLADTLHLDALKDLCMLKFRDLAFNKQLEPVVLASQLPVDRLTPHASPDVSKPAACPGTHDGPCSNLAWCAVHKQWACTSYVYYPGGPAQASCSCPASAPSLCIPITSWFANDRPSLTDGIRQLSRSTLEEMVVSLIVATGGNYRAGAIAAPVTL